MRRLLRPAALVAAVLLAVTGIGACGDGEDRPGEVTSEDDGGSPSGSASGTHTGAPAGSPSASGTGSASGTHAGEHEGGSQADFTKDEADTAVAVSAKDFRFEGIPATVKGKNVFFTVKNEGGAEHEFDVRDHGEIEPFEPGETETLALELEPGEYTVVCLVKEGNMTHEQMGMVATFTVTA